MLSLVLVIGGSGCLVKIQDSPVLTCNSGRSKSSLSLMTYNVHIFDTADILTQSLLQDVVGSFIDTYIAQTNSNVIDFRDVERTGLIADRILAQPNPPDLIVFTELWNRNLANLMIDKLQAVYPQFSRPDAQEDIFAGKVLGNGLMFFSKYPIISGSEKFVPFNSLVGADIYAVKGVGQVSVQVCDGPRITVFFTHAQALYPNEPQSLTAATDNLVQLAALVNQYRSATPGEGVLVAGDLNIGETMPIYSQFVSDLNSSDAYRAFLADANLYPDFTYDEVANALTGIYTQVNTASPLRERLDYVFYNADGPFSSVTGAADGNPLLEPLDGTLKGAFDFVDSQTGFTLPLSDHYPLRIDFALTTSQL